ncbi:hypothetical protein AVEN_213824-1 [Araneus ventricosus]|uniref:DDE-1 domain-containing protein n=1 Tax=Araneus ventricosus TaxID=182803 RepID=A0A4Y2NXJ8_ARAVE|nr:hypothetical protein AVEN_213824-1 [Araneus ventricosus]
MHTIRNAWDIVSSKTISNCYKKCGLNIADEADNLTKEIITNEEERMDETFLRYVSIDDNLQTSGEKSDSEIARDIINSKVMSNQEVEESVSEDEEIAVPNLPSSIDVRKALDILRYTLERRGDKEHFLLCFDKNGRVTIFIVVAPKRPYPDIRRTSPVVRNWFQSNSAQNNFIGNLCQ